MKDMLNWKTAFYAWGVVGIATLIFRDISRLSYACTLIALLDAYYKLWKRDESDD